MKLIYLFFSFLILACSQTNQPETTNTSATETTIVKPHTDSLQTAVNLPESAAPTSPKEAAVIKETNPIPVELYDMAPNQHSRGSINGQSIESLEAEKDYTSIYDVHHVDDIPSFIPSNQLNNYIKSHLVYPDSAKLAAGTSVEAQVNFLVHTDGHISDVRILRSCGHPLLDNAALEMARKMPAWQAGKSDGRPVRTNITIPVRFDF